MFNYVNIDQLIYQVRAQGFTWCTVHYPSGERIALISDKNEKKQTPEECETKLKNFLQHFGSAKYIVKCKVNASDVNDTIYTYHLNFEDIETYNAVPLNGTGIPSDRESIKAEIMAELKQENELTVLRQQVTQFQTNAGKFTGLVETLLTHFAGKFSGAKPQALQGTTQKTNNMNFEALAQQMAQLPQDEKKQLELCIAILRSHAPTGYLWDVCQAVQQNPGILAQMGQALGLNMASYQQAPVNMSNPAPGQQWQQPATTPQAATPMAGTPNSGPSFNYMPDNGKGVR